VRHGSPEHQRDQSETCYEINGSDIAAKEATETRIAKILATDHPILVVGWDRVQTHVPPYVQLCEDVPTDMTI